MDYVGKTAHTDHGLGTITEVDPGVRGGKQFRVAGKGFNVWVPETRLRLAGLETTIEQGDTHSYPVTYPYDPSPQYPVDLFRKEQTILPGDYEIDPDDRLHSSDEDGKRVSPNRPYPGPSPDLFAKGAAYHYAEEEPFQGDPYKEWGEDEWHSDLPDGPERTLDAAAPGRWDEARGGYTPHHPGKTHQGPLGETMFDGEDHTNYERSVEHSLRPEATYRPAGLSDRYAHIPNEVDERNPITAFRADPLGFMERRAYAMTAGEDEHLAVKFADYDNLLEASQKMRTAAWSDVRQKAQRLRHEGKVHVNHVTPQHIYATVNGDTGTYDTMIVKGASGAFSGGQSIANWYCDCDWGKWAFKRKYSYVGRLCSHAYAAYLDMQSDYHKGNEGKFKSASIVDDFKSWAKENNDGHMDRGAMTDFINTCDDRVTREEAEELYDYLLKNVQTPPERDFDVPYTFDNEEAYKTAADTDALRQRPLSLTPDLRVVPQDGENEWTDVTKDERETTGPDQIVHFGSLAAKLHTADNTDDWAKNLYGDAGPAAAGAARGIDKGLNDFGQGVNDWIGGVGRGIGNYFDTHPGPLRDAPGGDAPQGQPVSATSPVNPSQIPMDQVGPKGGGPVPTKQDLQNAFKVPGAPGAAAPSGPLQPGQTRDPDGTVHATNPNLNPGMVKNTIGGEGVGSGDKGTLGTGSGYGGAGFQGPNGTGPWNKSNETTGISGDSYQVKPGDTLHDIAQRSGLDVNDIAKNNGITDINSINSGQTLKLPGGGKGAPASPDLSQAAGGTKPVAPGSPADLAGPGASVAAGGTKPIAPGSPADLKTPQTPATPKPPAPPAAPGIDPDAAKFKQQVQDFDTTGKLSSLAYRLHMAADDDNNDDDQRPDTGEAAAKLDRLRELGEEDASDHYHHMDAYNDEIRDLVEELNEAGVDAMPFVANRFAAPQGQRKDNDPSDGDANFAGQSNPNWADEPFNGSGPDPQLWSSDSASWVDEHERPDFTDVTDLPDGDIIKFNDERSKPQQGPRHSHRLHADMDGGATIGDFSNMPGIDPAATLDPLANGGQQSGEGTVAHRLYADDQSGYFNPNNPSDEDWEEGSGRPFMDEVGHTVDQANPLHGLSGGGDAAGEEGGVAALGEEAPELLALASRSPAGGGFSLEAFDRGEFSFDDAGGGELRRAARIGGGAKQEVRVDRGSRGWEKEAQTYDLPEDFGNNGDPELASYSGDAGADPSGADIVASFQRSAGALEMAYGNGSAPRQGSLDDFSSSPMVQKMLRTAGRKFSPEEERELQDESHVLGARNMPTPEDLAGTHYLM